jgi:hypothetical protein
MANATANSDLLARDLARLLNDLGGLHAEMAGHMRDKLDAMRKADTERVSSITARELLLAEKVAEREGLRRQITRRLVETLGIRPAKAETMRISELAGLFPEPRRSQLLTAATGLRRKVEELQRLHRTNTLVTQAVLRHLSEVFAAMCVGPATESYTRGGRCAQHSAASVFEAVG